MVQCELCGKVTRTTQGLRGHKTFIHGLSADHTKVKTVLDKNRPMDETSNLVEPEKNNYKASLH